MVNLKLWGCKNWWETQPNFNHFFHLKYNFNLTIIYVRAGYVCMFVCPSTPPTVMNRSSWNFAGVMSLPPLKTGNKIFLIGRKKNFRNFWGIAWGRGMSAFISLTVLTRSSWNFAGVILLLLLTTEDKKNFWSDKKILKKTFFEKKIFFFRICRIFMELAAGHYCLPQELAWKLRP